MVVPLVVGLLFQTNPTAWARTWDALANAMAVIASKAKFVPTGPFREPKKVRGPCLRRLKGAGILTGAFTPHELYLSILECLLRLLLHVANLTVRELQL